MACYCCVLGCKNNNHKVGSARHFFRFPKSDPKRHRLWTKFARKRVNQTSVICEDHFEARFKKQKDKKLKLTNDAVPTIFLKPEEDGITKVTVQFDGENYVGDEAQEMQKASDQEIIAIETAFVNEQIRLDDLKSRCRFCSELRSETIEMATFTTFNIEIKDFLSSLRLTAPDSDFFPNSVCEECFNQVIQLDAFVVKCQTAEQWFWDEIGKLKTITPAVESPSKEQTEQTDGVSHEEVIKMEHLGDDDFIESIIPEGESECEETVEQTYEIEYEPRAESVESELPPVKKAKLPESAILDPTCNKFALKTYECELCQKLFAGLKTFKNHVCDVPEISCSECGDVFPTVFALRSHQKHLHKDPTEKNFCQSCKMVITGNQTVFKKHKLKCNNEGVGEFNCEQCMKTFPTLHLFTVHQIFHENQKKTEQDVLMTAGRKSTKKKAEIICELCGKSYTTMGDCKRHIKLKHMEITELFTCNVCNKNYPSQSVLKDHFRNTHVVNEVPCTFCGKIFRNKTHLKKHMVYHDESKKVHKCLICPNQPGFVNKVGLLRHQAKHSSSDSSFSCEICVNYNFHSSFQLKSHMKHVHAIEQA